MKNTPIPRRLVPGFALLAAIHGCGSSMELSPPHHQSAVAGGEATYMQSFADEEGAYDVALDDSFGPMEAESEQRMAAAPAASPPPAAASAKQAADKTPPPSTMPTERRERGPMLIYQAWLTMAVYEVETRQREVIAIAEAHDGFLANEGGAQLILRVPAARYGEALAAIEKVGDVLDRRVQTEDVGEQFRDLRTRIDSARKVRERLLSLLDKAVNVEESLRIERELERLLKEIEQLEGKLKYLSDRIAFSTITVSFQPLAEEQPADDVKLPFEWLDALGLRNLTEL